MSETCVSMRVLAPFISLLKREARAPAYLLEEFEGVQPEQRISISTAIHFLDQAQQATGDLTLGLRAAREVKRGDYDLLEYLAFSSRSVRHGFQVLSEYVRLISDACSFKLSDQGETTHVCFDSGVPLNRVATEFKSALLFEVIRHWWRQPIHPSISVSFRHSAPADLSEYRKTFGDCNLVFCSRFDGFAIPSELLDVPQPTADPRLHDLLRRWADREVSTLRSQPSFSHRVQRILSEQIREGRVCADTVAARLRMSRRTLSRRLDQEGTGFRALLDELRRSLATRYLVEDGLSVAEVAQLLGFAEVAAFHRAFKRWYNETPHRYRTERAIQLSAQQAEATAHEQRV